MQLILAAILLLSPHLPREEAARYAKTIHTMCKTQHVDPYLVVSIIRAESSFDPNKRSPTNDFGLMQLHVSHTTFADLRGHGKLLYDPELNIYLGVKHLRMFRKWHQRKCSGGHRWWRHYKWGYRRRNFPDNKWEQRVQGFHDQIVAKLLVPRLAAKGAQLTAAPQLVYNAYHE